MDGTDYSILKKIFTKHVNNYLKDDYDILRQLQTIKLILEIDSIFNSQNEKKPVPKI